jgi:CRP/FNR family transcriptional regulator
MSNRSEQITQRLRGIPFFEDLDDAAILDLAHSTQWREYGPGQVIVLEGQAQPDLYLLDYGYVKVVKVSPSGREQTLRILEPGDTFNEIGVFAHRPNPATAIALELVGVWIIRHEALACLLREHPDFAQSVIEKMAERMLFLVSLVSDLSLRPVTGRLARLLLESATGDMVPRPRWFTQAELAARLGTVPDVVQRSLRSLEADQMIVVDRQQIRLLNHSALERIAA